MTLKFALIAVAAAVSIASPALAGAPSAKDFARLPALTSLSISPDGQRIAGISSPDGEHTIIKVWKTDALDQPPVSIGVGERSRRDDQQRFISVRFIKNDRIAVTLRQVYGESGVRTHFFRTLISDVDGKGVWRTSLGDGNQWGQSPPIVSSLPKDPRHILVQVSELDLYLARKEGKDGLGDGDIEKVDIYSGQYGLYYRGSDRFSYQLDIDGNIRGKQGGGFDNGKVFIAQYLKNPDNGVIDEHFRWYAKDREPQEVVAFENDPNLALVRSTKGRDKAAIFEYDVRAKKYSELAFESPLFDAAGVVQSRGANDYGQVLGFTYNADRLRTYWIDDRLAKLEDAVGKALGAKSAQVDWIDPATGRTAKVQIDDGVGVSIVGMSDDRSRIIFEKSGPKAPPEYYLYVEGKPLQLLERSMPQIDGSALGDTRLVQFKARDGLMIPAYLTTPPASFGKGPHRALVLPHGGPWARDELGWDPTGWVQYFAARGYVVIQPQFRGSQGWGQKLWRAGDGQWGLAMQDDDDDAAKWLIAKGLADPKRIAIFGYSYGGYAAMAAAVRPNGLYQCAIAGAGVAELKNFQADTSASRFLQEFQRPTVEGMDPLAHAGEVSIPLLLIHGDRDVTVPTSESRRMDAALGAKVHRLVISADMGHQFNRWQPKDIELMLTETERFLTSECRPGGL